MAHPTLSVIIPVAGHRGPFLGEAVRSALEVFPRGEVEVIVVPNGVGDAWRSALADYAGNPAVRVFPIATPHGCAARNHGVRQAVGDLVRFLDDDDFLYPAAAARQCRQMLDAGVDVCSGGVDVVDEAGTPTGLRGQPAVGSLVAAVLHRARFAQPTAHVFRRALALSVPWDETLPYGQDIDWLFRLSVVAPLTWLRCDDVVGGWRQHAGQRISTSAQMHRKRERVAKGILDVVSELDRQGRLTREAREAAAGGLWDGVYTDLARRPLYWTRMAWRARLLDPSSHPDAPVYSSRIFRSLRISPVLWEWLVLPKRMLARGLSGAFRR